jgi:hypothetical protein
MFFLFRQNFTTNDIKKGLVTSTNEFFGEKYPKFATFQGKMGCNPQIHIIGFANCQYIMRFPIFFFFSTLLGDAAQVH